MNRTRVVRIAASATAFVVVTFLFVWFVGSLIPGRPMECEPAPGPADPRLHRIEALASADVVEVAFGEAKTMESPTLKSDAFDASLLGDIQAALAAHGVLLAEKKGDSWRFDMADMRFQVVEARVVDQDAFEQWYPHYADMLFGLSFYEEYETKYIVVKAKISNVGEESQVMVLPWLWSSKFAHADAAGFLGSSTTPLLVEEMQGSPQESSNTRQYALEEGWNVLDPSCERELSLAFPVYRSMFASADDFDSVGADDFAMQFIDCDPAVFYRFMLG